VSGQLVLAPTTEQEDSVAVRNPPRGPAPDGQPKHVSLVLAAYLVELRERAA
jgi:hypothetical protein